MDTVVKIGEYLGKKALEAQESARKAGEQRPIDQKLTTAQIKRFSRENNWVSHHDVVDVDRLKVIMHRMVLNRETRVNFGKLVDLLKNYGLLRKRTTYDVVFHEDARMYAIHEAFSGKRVLLVKSSECMGVWDLGVE